MGMAAILVMWPGPFEPTLVPPILRSLHMKFEFNWPRGYRGEDFWNCGRTDARVTGILLAHQWAFGSGELKMGEEWIIPNTCTAEAAFILFWNTVDPDKLIRIHCEFSTPIENTVLQLEWCMLTG